MTITSTENTNGPLAGTDSALTSISPLEATIPRVQEVNNGNIDGVENNPVTYYGDESYSLTLTMIPWLR
jgi:hypothetical protein